MSSMIPGKNDDELAWKALQRRVADQAVETAFAEDKRRLRTLEDQYLKVVEKVERILRDYSDLVKAYDRLVTQHEFLPVKWISYALAAGMVIGFIFSWIVKK